MDYHQNFNLSRSNNAEMKERDKLYEDSLQNLRKAAEVHRQVRKHCQTIIRPGRKLIDICEEIEELNRYLV
jgi:methionyl aminopeptidase